MNRMLKLALIVGAIAALGSAMPAFAQSFTSTFGTGNTGSCYYDQNGALQVAIPAQGQSGASAFAEAPAEVASGACSPALTGGGNLGYNEKLLSD